MTEEKPTKESMEELLDAMQTASEYEWNKRPARLHWNAKDQKCLDAIRALISPLPAPKVVTREQVIAAMKKHSICPFRDGDNGRSDIQAFLADLGFEVVEKKP